MELVIVLIVFSRYILHMRTLVILSIIFCPLTLHDTYLRNQVPILLFNELHFTETLTLPVGTNLYVRKLATIEFIRIFNWT